MGQFDAVKQHIVEACRGLVEKGYLMATGGNVSARINRVTSPEAARSRTCGARSWPTC